MKKYRVCVSYPVTVWRDFETIVEAESESEAEDLGLDEFREARLQDYPSDRNNLAISASTDFNQD